MNTDLLGCFVVLSFIHFFHYGVVRDYYVRYKENIAERKYDKQSLDKRSTDSKYIIFIGYIIFVSLFNYVYFELKYNYYIFQKLK